MIEQDFLTPCRMSCLQALIDTLIPPDESLGGWDAGVGDYLLGQFNRDLAASVDMYRSGLDLLNAEALDIAGASFASLGLDTRTDLLKALEAGRCQVEWGSWSAKKFIGIAARHAAEGFYSDPGNGGNRGAASWQMIGFEVRG